MVGYYVRGIRRDALKGSIIKIVKKSLVLSKGVKREEVGGVRTQPKEILSS